MIVSSRPARELRSIVNAMSLYKALLLSAPTDFIVRGALCVRRSTALPSAAGWTALPR